MNETIKVEVILIPNEFIVCLQNCELQRWSQGTVRSQNLGKLSGTVKCTVSAAYPEKHKGGCFEGQCYSTVSCPWTSAVLQSGPELGFLFLFLVCMGVHAHAQNCFFIFNRIPYHLNLSGRKACPPPICKTDGRNIPLHSLQQVHGVWAQLSEASCSRLIFAQLA